MEKPADPLKWIELVLDNRGELCEMNRLPGENEVRSGFRVATAQGKQGIWFLLFPDRENTGNFAVTQGKFLRHRENIFNCIYHCQKHVFLHIFSIFFSLASFDILSSFRSLFLILFLLVYQCIYCLTFFTYHIGYKVSTKLILLKTNLKNVIWNMYI